MIFNICKSSCLVGLYYKNFSCVYLSVQMSTHSTQLKDDIGIINLFLIKLYTSNQHF